MSLGRYILCAHVYQIQGQMPGHRGVEGSHLRGLLSKAHSVRKQQHGV